MSFGDDLHEMEPLPATARQRILAALTELGPEEALVLALVAERLAAGRRVYGELHTATDSRSFGREALEEVADALVYTAAALVRAGQPSGPPADGRAQRGGW